MTFTLNDLKDSEFEEFCYDLLHSMDFVNLSWRKGTGLLSSPSDQGRDIQGQLLRRDVDGSQHHEQWFIECKHYIKGVPPEKIQSALAWANSKRPDVLLIIVSNFLSNPTKNYLEEYQREHKPPFRIKVWELKDLENLSAGKKELRQKYNLANELSYLPVLNRYHIAYTMKPQLNSIGYLIELMDSLDADKRDEAFSMAYYQIIRPRFRTPISPDETIGDLMLDSVDYESFRKKCFSMASENSRQFVYNFITLALAWLFNSADITSLDDMKNTQKWLIEHIENEILETDNEIQKNKLRKMIKLPIKTLNELPNKVKKSYDIYNYVCEELVRKLLVEKLR
ncbi:restriction endonuclease [Aeromonas sp. FDAARGOS 1407]|uniref:restriction endonuclease n=1 Tax=Aeromonas TaxID=642 RepID=UPI001C23E62D|nr:restriction endonuclease [Aeromonas sp. FDAARGOS 1407]QXC34519.1 restriction endonuclease [Aeromonas sp. FDAARGOS 1407]